MKWLSRLLCWFDGHDWLYNPYYSERICISCHKEQTTGLTLDWVDK